MRILLLTDSDVFAGTERHILDLGMALHQLGHTITVGCAAANVLVNRAKAGGLSVFAVRRGRGSVPGNIARLVGELRTNRLDIIHAHNGQTALWAALAISLSGRGRLITTQHFLDPARTGRSSWKRWLSEIAHHWIGRMTSRMIAISDAVRLTILARREIDLQKVRVVLNGIAEPERLPCHPSVRDILQIGPATPLIVCCARLEAEKQVDVLIKAMRSVASALPKVCCVVAGEGKLKPLLDRLIAELNLSRIVTLLGFRSDAIEFVAASDLFVLPSLAEPFGLSLVEAMALGKPAIATKAGGPMEIIIHKETGLLVPPSDPLALSNAILRILQDRALAQRMGSNGRTRFIQHFTAARMAAELSMIYDAALGNDSGLPAEARMTNPLNSFCKS